MNYEKYLSKPLEEYAKQCHACCLELIKNDDFRHHFAFARIARGFHDNISGQHSWIVAWEKETETMGDVFDKNAIIIDPTLWSYPDDATIEMAIECVLNMDYDNPEDYIYGLSFDDYKHVLPAKIEIYKDDIDLYHPHGEIVNNSFNIDDFNKSKYNHDFYDRKIINPFANNEYLDFVFDNNQYVSAGKILYHLNYFADSFQKRNDIIDVMLYNKQDALIPIDYLGMFTNYNPSGLYLNKMDEKKFSIPEQTINVKKKLKI